MEDSVVRVDSADEFSVLQTKHGDLYAWGKNDRGQMGTGAGIGIDMVECENVPTLVDLRDESDQIIPAKSFAMGQNSMLVQDENNKIYMIGQKLHYTPSKIQFDPNVLDVNSVRMMGCGRKHFFIINNDNNLLVWGNNIFKEKSEIHTEGFDFFYGDNLFNGGIVSQLEVKYGIFGCLVQH
jgi:alpha-tubulin suppressor-like RCC1 family protein